MSQHGYRRRSTATVLVSLIAGLALPCAAIAAPGGSVATGGTAFHETPAISKLECRTLCGASAAGRENVVVVREDGVLRIRGRHLDAVEEVLFLGKSGRSDNASSSATLVNARTVEVRVPLVANSGRVALVDDAGHRSKPSPAGVKVIHPPRAPGGSAPSGSVRLAWPVRGPITGTFGEDRGDHIHKGLDISAPGGTPIRAAAAGVVSLLGPQGGYGNFTCIRHTALTTCYAHQSRFGTRFGASVRQGQVIGYVGNTGNSFGNHLHFEVRQSTQPWSAPLNPLAYLPKRG